MTPSRTRWALASLSLSMLLSSLGTSIANVALPALAHAFGASFRHVQWIVIAYLLASTTLIVGAGRLGDVLGRRRLLLAGLALFTVASLVCGLAPVLWLLIAARAAQGLGAAAMMALAMAFVGDMVPKARIGRTMGLLGTTSAIGTALGPSLGGLLLGKLGWPAIFLVNVPLGLLGLLLAQRHLPEDRPAPETSGRERAGFDSVGTVLLAVTVAAYALAMTMFRDARLRTRLATSVLVSTVIMATLVVGPFYLSLSLGLGAVVVGLVLSVGPLVAAVTGLPAGRLADRFGPERMTLFGLGGMAAGCVVLSVMPASLGVPGYVAPIALVTVGYALFQTANNTAVMANVVPSLRGVTSGLLNLSRNLGLITGASVMGAVFAFGSASGDVATARPEAVAAGMRLTFLVAALLIVVALVLAAGRRFSLSLLSLLSLLSRERAERAVAKA